MSAPATAFVSMALGRYLRAFSAAILLIATPFSQASVAAPQALEQAVPGNWQRWGSGEMRWLGFELYRATLWVAPPAQSLDQAPHALVLHYRRAIKAERLVSVSLDEMRQLGIDEARLARWSGELRRVFRDVETGDSITGLHRPGVGASFYHGARHTGDVDDPEFARAFFAIWLDERTSAPRLREVLLRRPVVAEQG